MKKILVTIGLIVGGLVLSFICLEEANITSLLSYHGRNVFSSYISGPIDLKQNITGEFQATYNNLAMVKLRIHTFNRLNTTHVRFQLKEKGKADWFATNTYAVDRFPDGLLYPFGFPAIAGSKGKVYEFMLESLDGAPDNAIGIGNGYHGVASQYVFQKRELLGDKELLRTFLVAKIQNILLDPYAMLYFSVFLVPAAAFYAKRYGLGLVLYMALVYTYLPLSIHSNTILFIAASLFFVARFLQLEASLIYSLGLLWLAQIPLALIFGNLLAANRAAMLLFFFILTGVIISVKELSRK